MHSVRSLQALVVEMVLFVFMNKWWYSTNRATNQLEQVVVVVAHHLLDGDYSLFALVQTNIPREESNKKLFD